MADHDRRQVANKKQRDTAAADEEMKRRRRDSDKHGTGVGIDKRATISGDILVGEEEDDVIF